MTVIANLYLWNKIKVKPQRYTVTI